MKTAVEQVVESVRTRLGLDAEARGEDGVTIARLAARRHAEIVGGVGVDGEDTLAAAAVAEVSGFGSLQPLLDDETVEEIWINGPESVFIARAGVSERIPLGLTADQVRHLIERMLRSTGRRVDTSSPFVDASLPDGSRLHVVIPDVTRTHWSVNIRKFSRRLTSLDALLACGSITSEQVKYLTGRVAAGANILISGATQAGKTTLLNSLLSEVSGGQRIVTVEETFELNIRADDLVGLQCRQPNLEGGGEITLRRLIKEALRMRPDRLVVGEVREAESLDLLIALNSGLPGACTIHANSARDALTKLCTLPLLAGRNIDASFVVPTVAACIDTVVHCTRAEDGSRAVSEILQVPGTLTDGAIDAEVVTL